MNGSCARRGGWHWTVERHLRGGLLVTVARVLKIYVTVTSMHVYCGEKTGSSKWVSHAWVDWQATVLRGIALTGDSGCETVSLSLHCQSDGRKCQSSEEPDVGSMAMTVVVVLAAF